MKKIVKKLPKIVPKSKETYQEMKKINPNVKVILVSGYSQNEEAKQILEEGASGFLQKPYMHTKKLAYPIFPIWLMGMVWSFKIISQ